MTDPARLAALPARFDLLVIGGGITGAGIALEAARRGVKVLLAEARDFAWGTSSRSSKLVHGGLRYLKEGKPGLTAESVRERDRLLAEAPGLVEPLGFVFAHHAGRGVGRPTMQLGLAVYDLIAGRRGRGWIDATEARLRVPGLAAEGLRGASLYVDAGTDDARLVQRVLAEAEAAGAVVRNHLRAQDLRRDSRGRVVGAALVDTDGTGRVEIEAACTIAATGAWADALRGQLGAKPLLRPLRGSHLLLPAWRLPLAQALAWMHPDDGRPIFAYPWEGNTLVGTTDLDHPDPAIEPSIQAEELRYLLRALEPVLPGLQATPADIVSTWAGVRPVIDSGRGLAPSKESRDHLVRDEQGLITVTGGKLTTFRRIAQDALAKAAARLPMLRAAPDDHILPPPGPLPAAAAARLARLPAVQQRRLAGRYGSRLADWLDQARADELQELAGAPVGGAPLVADLRWALRHEQVRHLDDLLLRRTRLGLSLVAGGAAVLPALRPLVQAELGWDDARWDAECAAYERLIRRQHALPEPVSP